MNSIFIAGARYMGALPRANIYWISALGHRHGSRRRPPNIK